MKLSPSTRIHALIDKYPFLLDFLAGYNPKFKFLKNRAMRATMGRMATLSMVAETGGVPLENLIRDVAEEIGRRTGEDAGAGSRDDRAKLDRLKNIIRDLHRGVEFSDVKRRFDELMGGIDPSRIAEMEEELIREGMPVEEIQRLCDLHVSVFQDALERQEPVKAPPGHPVHTYMEENRKIGELVSAFDSLVKELTGKKSIPGKGKILEVLDGLAGIETHYIRKENQLFPFLEKHGISGPSQVMWGIHDEIRGRLKNMRKYVEEERVEDIVRDAPGVSRDIVEMIHKENTILFPMAMDILSDDEWREIRWGEDEIGYTFTSPGTEWPGEKFEESGGERTVDKGTVKLDTGALTPEQVNLMLKHLPVEVSFVDENDEVRFYSDTPERIFPRSPGVIGRKVQKCHPPKSVHVVERILDAFKSGGKDHADFWIDTGGRLIYIRYFAVRDSEGDYRGTIEVTQDITEIRRIEGERRLLAWDEENR